MLRVSSKRYWDHENYVFWRVSAMKKSFRRKFSQKLELTHPPLPHASWLHVTWRIIKRLKYRVLSEKWTENKAKVVLICVFYTISDQNVTNFDQHWTALNQRKTALKSSETALFQRKTALKQLCFREKQLWNSSVSEKNSSETALNRADNL